MTREDGTKYNLKWASFNIGASKPWEYGYYYAWGECEPKADYSYETYAHANGDFDKLTKYCPKDKGSLWDATAKPDGPDKIVTLYPTDDVAHVKLGGKWRMPTKNEIQALLDLKDEAAKENSDYIWDLRGFATDENGDEVKDSNGNIIYGLRITRKSTGATLFLPATGYCNGTEIGRLAGARGEYWSSSLMTEHPERAHNLYFTAGKNTNETVDSGLNWENRNRGLTVRPVSE